MPIRFRCAYCNQLMGIARRKAGMVVRCPTCAGQLVVPNLEEEKPAPPAPTIPAGQELVFERNDFAELLGTAPASDTTKGPTIDSPPLAPFVPIPSVSPPGFTAQPGILLPQGPIASQPGLILSHRVVTILSVAILAGLALAFALGFLLGFLLRPDHREEKPQATVTQQVSQKREFGIQS